MAECFIYGQSGDSSELIFKFKSENLLLDAIPNSTFFTITQENGKVVITVPETTTAAWYQIFDSIPFKLNTLYKLTVSNFEYGRIGFSNKENNPHNGWGDTNVSANTNACVFSTAEAKDDEVNGDNYIISSTSHVAYFMINLETGSDSATSQNGTLWFCSDVLYNGDRKGYSFEICLQEQESVEIN